ncbi:hypothetical protein A3SI_14854 [Nitritalea halalkaliphila LW7]|uniref:Uncharacterized protein n=1 Tax=Nitritalea halalkaliphila LW7 TaxID=1189621 RepID=I5BZ73_9BACT|nr:hypothetical protein [Nitritalea halalkaliphila]EIM74875.1 hypothetical protein A3SI_14854 [Nitritalea halalkaliphila LW7]
MRISILCIILLTGLNYISSAQSIQKISDNRKIQFDSNYFQKDEFGDTVIIVFGTSRKYTKEFYEIHFPGEFDFKFIEFVRKYPDKNDCTKLVFYHMAAPHQGHEEYLIHKARLDRTQVIFDQEVDFLYWFNNSGKLMEKTLILVREEEWIGKKKRVNGIGVQINTFGSCRDLIEN